jgi:hypothetical protein
MSGTAVKTIISGVNVVMSLPLFTPSFGSSYRHLTLVITLGRALSVFILVMKIDGLPELKNTSNYSH